MSSILIENIEFKSEWKSSRVTVSKLRPEGAEQGFLTGFVKAAGVDYQVKGKSAQVWLPIVVAKSLAIGQTIDGYEIVTELSHTPLFDGHVQAEDGLYKQNRVLEEDKVEEFNAKMALIKPKAKSLVVANPFANAIPVAEGVNPFA